MADFTNFVTDKRRFFEFLAEPQEGGQKVFKLIKKKAEDHNYKFYLDNKLYLVGEFELLWKGLKEKTVDREIFWFYAYYCSTMLQNFYEAYGQDEKAKEFKRHRKEIKRKFGLVKEPLTQTAKVDESSSPPDLKKSQQDVDDFFDYIGDKIITAIADLVTSFAKVSEIRNLVSVANIYRIYWVFCRTVVIKGFNLARDLKLLDLIGNTLGKNIDVDNLASILETPTQGLKVLSVGFFAFRFLLNAGMLIKHVYFRPAGEKSCGKLDRLYEELYKRHASFLNDVVWGIVNFITNYNALLGITDPTAGWIVGGFLFFDFCLLIWTHLLAEKEYQAKRLQLEDDLKFFTRQLAEAKNQEQEVDRYYDHCLLLMRQRDQLDLNWQAKSATIWFNAGAALLLALGFSASMIFTPAALVLASYMICTLAVAMYMSAGAYENYKAKKLQFDYIKEKNNDAKEKDNILEEKLLNEYRAARNEFIWTLVKNTIRPALVIATFAICWQAALVLTALYIGYSLYSGYIEKAKEKEQSENQLEDFSGMKAAN